MNRFFLILLFFSIHVVGLHADNPRSDFSGINLRLGVRILSLQSLNDALQNEGLAEVNPIAFSYNLGFTRFNEKFVTNLNFISFRAYGQKNQNKSNFQGLGISFDLGYQIFGNEKMSLYPYVNLSFIQNRFQTHQQSNASNFSAIYAQQLVERTFIRGSEFGSALGLSYQIKIAKNHLLRVGGGYHFRFWQPFDWYHQLENKVNFPKVDNSGWEVGITWVRKRLNK